MDFINETDVFNKIVSPAIDKINNETIPTAERAIQRQVEAAAAQLNGLLTDALIAFRTSAESLIEELDQKIASRFQKFSS